MRRRRLKHVLPIIIGPVLVGLAIAAPASAGSLPAHAPQPNSHSLSTTTVPDIGPSARAGFVAVAASGTVEHLTTFNSAGGIVSVNHPAAGDYTVFFQGLGFAGGNVQVTPEVDGITCPVDSWGPSGSDLAVTLHCTNLAGTLTDESFFLLVTKPRTAPNGVLDFDLVHATQHGKLTGASQFNSSHKTNSVKHPARGQYVVTMPGPGTSGGNKGTVKVSPFGPGSGFCQIAHWKVLRTGEQVTVFCFSGTGAPQNNAFTITYARSNNLMGENGKRDANALANRVTDLYQPGTQFDSRAHARISIARLQRGIDEVFFAGSNVTGDFSGGLGNLQLTPVGTSFRTCFTDYEPFHMPVASVECFSASGHLVEAQFTTQLVIN